MSVKITKYQTITFLMNGSDKEPLTLQLPLTLRLPYVHVDKFGIICSDCKANNYPKVSVLGFCCNSRRNGKPVVMLASTQDK